MQGDLNTEVGKNLNSQVDGDFDQHANGNLSIASVKGTAIHTQADVYVKSDGKASFAAAKKLQIKSGVKADIAKGDV